MASFCSGGLSQPKSGVVGQITASVEAVAAVLALTGLELPAALIAVIGAGINFAAPSFCAADPPADPHPTQQDLYDALQFSNPSISLPAAFKWQQWFLSHYWYQICECTNGTTPAPPALSPPGSSTNNPGLPSGPNEACFTGAHTFAIPQTTTLQTTDGLKSLVPVAGTPLTKTGLFNFPVGNSTTILWPVDPRIQSMHFVATGLRSDPSLSNTAHMQGTWHAWNDVTQTDTANLFGFAGDSLERSFTVIQGQAVYWPVGTTHYGLTLAAATFNPPSSVIEQLDYSVTATCVGSPLEQPCCPPDPSIDARLNQIIAYLTVLLQRQNPTTSTSWRDGTRHTGLTGNGRLVLSAGATAVRIEITTMPPGLPQIHGDPNFFFDLGFITPLAADIPLRGQRLVFNPENFALPAQADGISWTLAVGAVINLVELLPN